MRGTGLFWFFVLLAAGGLAGLHCIAALYPERHLPKTSDAPASVAPSAPYENRTQNMSLLQAGVRREPQSQRVEGAQPDLILYRTENQALRGQIVYAVKCVGGPADQYTHLLTHHPLNLIRSGASCVWVTTADLYHYHPPVKAEKTTDKEAKEDKVGPRIFFVMKQIHESQMEISSIGLYMLEEREGQFQLGFIGSADLAMYADLIKPKAPEKATSAKTEQPDHECIIPIETATKTIRKQHVYRVKCVGGSADGGVAFLTAEPGKLFREGCNTVWVSDLCIYPSPDPRFLSLGQPEDKSRLRIGHVSLYILEEDASKCHHLRFLGRCLSEDYVKRHVAIGHKKSGVQGDKP